MTVATNTIGMSLILLLLSGCATTAKYEKILGSWVGSHVDDLAISWGPPQSSFPLSNGGKVIEYVHSNNARVGGYTYTTPQTTYNSGTASVYGSSGSAYGTYSGTSTTYVQKQSPVYNIHMYCKTRFTIDINGIINKWNWQGNNCRAK